MTDHKKPKRNAHAKKSSHGGNFDVTGLLTAGVALGLNELAQRNLGKRGKHGKQHGGEGTDELPLPEGFQPSSVPAPAVPSAPVTSSAPTGPAVPAVPEHFGNPTTGGMMSIQDNAVQSGGRKRKPSAKPKAAKPASKPSSSRRRHRGGGDGDGEFTGFDLPQAAQKEVMCTVPKKAINCDEDDSREEKAPEDPDNVVVGGKGRKKRVVKAAAPKKKAHAKKKGGDGETTENIADQLQKFLEQQKQEDGQTGGTHHKKKHVAPKKKRVTVGGALQMYSKQLESLAQQINSMTMKH